MSQLVGGRSLRMAAAWLVVASLLGCRRPTSDEPCPETCRSAERAPAGTDEAASATVTKAEGRAVVTSPDGVQPPAGYVVVRPKDQLDAARGNALLLVDVPEKHVVPIFVGGTEALSIRLRLDAQHYPRPLTHDLLDTLLRRLGARFESSQIDELRDNTFIGTVVVRDRDGQVLRIDARPSDAVALAIGNKAPIFMAQSVIDRAGYRIDQLDKIGKPSGEPTRL
jgi:hypothetical protein